MKFFAVYAPSTGLIAQINGADKIESVQAICVDDQAVVEIDPGTSDTTHYIDAGAPVAFPQRPSPNHAWDAAAKAWVDPRTLDQLKDETWIKVKKWREKVFDAPLATPFGTFDSDAKGRDSIKEAVLLANNLVALGMPSDIRFTRADDVRQTFTATQIVQMGLLLALKKQNAYDVADQLRAQVDAATTAAQLDAIQWPT